MALSGCSDDDIYYTEDTGTLTAPSSETEMTSDNTEKLSASEFGLSVKLDENGRLDIKRNAPGSVPMGDEGSWTVFVYLCGTDLESDSGFATGDMSEMLEASTGGNMRFVVQTGGTYEWQNDVVGSGDICRYEISEGEIELLDQQPAASMGDADTLADFLKWGVESCPAAKMGVILWNHGGGSISGVCFDELSYGDSLSPTEINSALSEVSGSMTDKFEFIGFDACLMGTVETANILASYSRYMYGSEETEPGYGWDYAAIGNYLGEDPSADGAMLGRIVCDSFYEGCEEIGLDSGATLSVIDLSVIDDVIISFNDYAKALYEVSEDRAVLAEVIRCVNNADNYGGNIVTVVIDNVNSIESNDMRNEIKALCGNKKLWVIILGSSRMPSWLYDTFITRNMLLVAQEELALSEEGIDKYMRSEGIILTADELRFHRQCSEGNLYGVKFTAQQLLAGDRIGKELFEKNSAMFQRYLENSIISELNTEISDFLLKVCIVDDFTEPLAKTITGNSAALSLIERTLDSGNFIDNKDGVYTLHPQMLNALRKKLSRSFLKTNFITMLSLQADITSNAVRTTRRLIYMPNTMNPPVSVNCLSAIREKIPNRDITLKCADIILCFQMRISKAMFI